MAEVTLHLQRLDQLLEWQVLMGLRAQRPLFDLLQQTAEGHLRIELGAQHLSIDEEADQTCCFDPVAVSDRHPDTDIRLPRVAVQQGLEARQQDHERGQALLLSQLLQAIDQVLSQADRQPSAVVAR
ncbi:hypothetical protein CCOS865_05516 [Pseudomonas reidholzensis]|uniref:Uncharacterized protein n=1 Tax=Pseudomonas reidholzensis TaxID=1785162 RepID=A0A383S1N7_9PSED|nr:hypothetical protein CCOS865_05516 [Pseudomonas reidholzensis]